jgi:hypothetical protein
VYHEIQLRTEGMSSFSISTDILDSNTEPVAATVPPILHWRTDGVMLRWNITQGGGPYFVSVTSSDRAMPFSIVVVVPPTYEWVPVEPMNEPQSGGTKTELVLSAGAAQAVELGFSFPFFGLVYDRVWITSAGYIVFEEPAQTDAFFGLDTVHSAIVAAAGDFDLTNPGATLSVSHRNRAGATRLDVVWRAPLYSSFKFSDVGLSLSDDGSVWIQWNRIDLAVGGSLKHKLELELTFEQLPTISSTGDSTGAPPSVGPPTDVVTITTGDDAKVSIINTDTTVFNTTIGAFYGGDPGEGLDFSGEFAYAVNVNGPADIRIGDAIFSSDANTTGLTISQDNNRWQDRSTEYITFGSSQDDVNLALVLDTARYSREKPIIIQLDALDPQSSYVLQLLGYENDGEMCFDVLVDDVLIVKHFDEAAIQGGINTHVSGAFLRYTFQTTDATSVTITVKRSDTPCPTGGSLPVVQAFTLERVTSLVYQGQTDLGSALRLVDDVYVELRQVMLGGSVAVSAWLQVGTLWDGTEGMTLLNSFQGSSCGDSDPCRNAVGKTLDRHGWLAVGNDVGARRPADLWAAGVVFDSQTTALFWEGARGEWLMVTFVVSAQEMHVYTGGQLRGIGSLEAPLPRMMREANYIGAGRGAPFRSKGLDVSLAIADFRLYDRSLTAPEVAALFSDPSGQHTACCVNSGIKSAFGAGDVDISSQAMDVAAMGAPAAVAFSSQLSSGGADSNATISDACATIKQKPSVVREVDICGTFAKVSECGGIISDGIGPYAKMADCVLNLEGYLGAQYTVSFEEFELVDDGDVLYIYDGKTENSPVLGVFTGRELPPMIKSSGPDLLLHFSSNANGQAIGFRASFACSGTPLEYWKPALVATELLLGIPTASTTMQNHRTACLSDVLLSVQCCADAELSCSNARVTGIGLSNHQLRGQLPEELSALGAMKSLKLHDNFLSGTVPLSLSKLHRLQELQLSHNQFEMQGRDSLSKVLGGLLQLRTLDLGMSDEKEDLGRSIILPAPPLACRVGEPCTFTLSTRTVTGLALPHGGLQVRVRKTAENTDQLCVDLMDGSYNCHLPNAWTTAQGDFDFLVSADGEDFIPIRTLTDPTTGIVSTVDTYVRLAVLVAPIECIMTHAHADDEGARCICEVGYYRLATISGSYSCEHCDRGHEPVEGGARCNLCAPGTFSATGQECVICPPGNEPNLLIGADSCIPCDGHSVSEYGDQCAKCESGEVADPSRTWCVCPAGLYNSSQYDGNTVHCVPKNLRSGGDKAVSSCAPCDGLSCVKCTAGLEVVPGWGTTGSASPWFVFSCPFKHACINTKHGARCREGHTGILCAECEPGYGLTGEECVACQTTMHRWYITAMILAIMITLGLVVYLWWQRQQQVKAKHTDELVMQLTDNPVQQYGIEQQRGSLSGRAAERTSNLYLAVRVLYQPGRILVGYIQVSSAAK